MSSNQGSMKKIKIEINTITRYLLTKDAKLKEMIDKRIHDDEKSRRDFDAYVEVWEKSADLQDFDKIDAAADWQKVRSRIRFNITNKRIPAKRYLIRIAAVLVVALGLTYILSRIVKEFTHENAFYTETLTTSETKTISLRDGSTIYLNRNSKIIQNADFGVRNRDIILEGEALFDVTHNEKLAFRVHTMNTIVEDIGTRFDVKSDNSQVIVGVLSGKVMFYKNADKKNHIELLPEHTGYYNTVTNQLKTDTTFDPNRIAWYSHEFVFRKTPLKEVFNTIADFYNLKNDINPDIRYADSMNFSISTESLDSIIITINDAVTEPIELINSNNTLSVRRR
jgi:transmembrane sensor